MYSTCTFCHAPLGRNEVLEHFPVGKRVAVDQARGRLWAVCPSCRQWNLSPLETRWEAIEEGEKLYRDSKLRVATEQIGLAKLRDGTELIRIGEPLRPEFAAWRYGTRFRSRRLRTLAGFATVTVLGGVAAAGPALGIGLASAALLPYHFYTMYGNARRARQIVLHAADEQGPLSLTRSHLASAKVVHAPDAPQGWALRVYRHRGALALGKWGPFTGWWDGASDLVGASALAVARLAMPEVNREGAADSIVREATTLLEAGTPVETLLRERAATTIAGDRESFLVRAPAPLRLALEMGLHEESERRALEGELQSLEARWREAEEIAAIADSLTLSERVFRTLDRLRES